MSRAATPPPDIGLRAVDRALADTLRRLDPSTDPAVLRAVELATLAIGHGHAALDLGRPEVLPDIAADWPAPADWHARLAGSAWVDTPAADATAAPDRPLVLEGNLLYLRRYREYERRLAHGLRRLAAPAPADDALRGLDDLMAALFPDAGDAQARAAAQALRRRLLLITGGPGTGKTTTIARVLVLLLARAQRAGAAVPRIALAAPTGRAAERMAQSLWRAIATLRERGLIEPAWEQALPPQARTLHRLLGPVLGRPRFRFDTAHPLPFDVVVVDEASMVDLPLMCKLVEAVADGARLILLGDPDQLPSVEAGDVLAAVVASAQDVGEYTTTAPADSAADSAKVPARASQAAARAADARQGDLFAAAAPATEAPTGSHVGSSSPASATALPRVHLTRGYRQSAALELAPLAQAVRAGDAQAALAHLQSGECAGVHHHPDQLDPLAATSRDVLLEPWRTLAAQDDPASALALADRARLLTALRDGAQGAVLLNARIEEALAGAQRERYFHGRLLLVTENSYRHGLFNGDIGVCLRDGEGATVAWFPGGGDGVRAFHPAALPAHDSAFAMTVHKAQGSEYDTVWLQLPRQDARTLSRELVYTALTRARHALHLAGSEAVLRIALARHAQRISGLAARLR